MAFDLKEMVASRLGENYELHERHINRTLVAAQRVIGFDKVYARAEGAYLYDMDNNAYLDFLSGSSVFNIRRTWMPFSFAIPGPKRPKEPSNSRAPLRERNVSSHSKALFTGSASDRYL